MSFSFLTTSDVGFIIAPFSFSIARGEGVLYFLQFISFKNFKDVVKIVGFSAQKGRSPNSLWPLRVIVGLSYDVSVELEVSKYNIFTPDN